MGLIKELIKEFGEEAIECIGHMTTNYKEYSTRFIFDKSRVLERGYIGDLGTWTPSKYFL